MLISNKFNGYSRDGIRLYHFGGGGGGGGAAPPPPPPPPRMPSAAPAPTYTTYGSGDRTGSLVQSGNSFRPSTLDYSRPIYDPNYADNITGYQQSSQFFQPIYQQQQPNYTNPLTALNVSSYGTKPGMSRSLQAATAPGASGAGAYYKHLQSYGDVLSGMPGGANINTLMNDMRQYGISPQDLQSAYSYTPPPPQPNYGGGGGYPDGNLIMFSYPQPIQQKYDSGYSGGYETQGPFSYQQPMQQQMQTPFSYQQPMQQQMQQPMQRTSSGPSQAIVGRSSQMRGTPNVMRRAEGGIASLLDNDE